MVGPDHPVPVRQPDATSRSGASRRAASFASRPNWACSADFAYAQGTTPGPACRSIPSTRGSVAGPLRYGSEQGFGAQIIGTMVGASTTRSATRPTSRRRPTSTSTRPSATLRRPRQGQCRRLQHHQRQVLELPGRDRRRRRPTPARSLRPARPLLRRQPDDEMVVPAALSAERLPAPSTRLHACRWRYRLRCMGWRCCRSAVRRHLGQHAGRRAAPSWSKFSAGRAHRRATNAEPDSRCRPKQTLDATGRRRHRTRRGRRSAARRPPTSRSRRSPTPPTSMPEIKVELPPPEEPPPLEGDRSEAGRAAEAAAPPKPAHSRARPAGTARQCRPGRRRTP